MKKIESLKSLIFVIWLRKKCLNRQKATFQAVALDINQIRTPGINLK